MANPFRYVRDLFALRPKAAGPATGSAEYWRKRALDLLAKYDAAQDTPENLQRWAGADALSANAAHDPVTCRKLRMRSRFEDANNAYCRGTIDRLANDLIGTGPRPDLTIPGVSDDVPRLIEDLWLGWSTEELVDVPDKLRVLEASTVRDGDSFAQLVTNPANRHPVKLNLRLFEADQCDTPDLAWGDPNAVPGIRFDAAGNPVEYHFLKQHPGDLAQLASPFAYDRVKAEFVIHWYKTTRPGQRRGVPEFQAALPLFATLRRYTYATLGAAELAACLAGVLKTQSAPADGGAVDVKTMEEIAIVRNALLTLPKGWDVGQVKAEQPTNTYPDFKAEVLAEIGRTLQVPLLVIAGTAKGSNFSQCKADLNPYYRERWVRRQAREARALSRIFRAFIDEAALARRPDGRPLIPAALPPIETWTVLWGWDGFDSIQPDVDAATDEKELANNTTTLAEICARKGTNWRQVLQQRARERAYATQLGLLDAAVAKPTAPAKPAADEADDAETADAETEAANAA